MIDATQYEKLEFQDKARGPDKGDCWYLVMRTYRDHYGLTLPSYTERYATTRDGEEIHALIDGEAERDWLRVEQPREGDLIILRIKGQPWHCGVVLRPPKFMHLSDGLGFSVQRWDSPMWALRVERFLRHKDLA